MGVWAARIGQEARERVVAWKRLHPYDVATQAELVADITKLIALWGGGVYPPASLVTVPPRGASLFGPSKDWDYAARLLAEAVADQLGLKFADVLERTDAKRWHGPWNSLKQSAYRCMIPDPRPGAILVVDDLVTSGRTMQLSLEALRQASVAAFGFAFCGT
jgi:predicted amidophosphoribosyltransferase